MSTYIVSHQLVDDFMYVLYLIKMFLIVCNCFLPEPGIFLIVCMYVGTCFILA